MFIGMGIIETAVELSYNHTLVVVLVEMEQDK